MKLKHTPGPWEIIGYGPHGLNVGIANPHFSNWFIATGVSPNDARLIAAAPEMLEALIYMCNLGYTCDNMTVAIERATGLSIEEVLEEVE